MREKFLLGTYIGFFGFITVGLWATSWYLSVKLIITGFIVLVGGIIFNQGLDKFNNILVKELTDSSNLSSTSGIDEFLLKLENRQKIKHISRSDLTKKLHKYTREQNK